MTTNAVPQGATLHQHMIEDGPQSYTRLVFHAVDWTGQAPSGVAIQVWHPDITTILGGEISPSEARKIAIGLLQAANEAETLDREFEMAQLREAFTGQDH